MSMPNFNLNINGLEGGRNLQKLPDPSCIYKVFELRKRMEIDHQPILLRIHGDNIIECQRGLYLIADSFSATVRHLVSPPYMPHYEIEDNGVVLFKVELLAGHGRWGVNIQDVFQSHGAPLREAADAVITKILDQNNSEEILLAVEFSSALPAGNNAWQRNGRALACVVAGVPYLYFTEVGGVELGKNRVVKAPRFPNPIVPFSYLTASEVYGVLCLPVYAPSPSSSEDIYAQFSQAIGVEDVKQVVRYAIEGNLSHQSYETLAHKVMVMVKILANGRKRVDTLRGDEWSEFLKLETGSQKTDWLTQKQMGWKKKRAGKVRTTDTFQNLIELFDRVQSISVSASDIPICLIPQDERLSFANKILGLYGNLIDPQFIKWLASDSPLVVVWITGFKPRGDDSRPDRGLVPLARMLFGEKVEILSIVSGPAKPAMWALLREDAQQLARQNGLWEAIIHLSNGVLADSPTLTDGPLTLLLDPTPKQNQKSIHFPMASPVTSFSEHDVDSIIHLLFSTNMEMGVFEGMCNPPGGDWSGLSMMNFQVRSEFRWTSLPRVSAVGGKRPDHVIQFGSEGENFTLLAIESKDVPSKIAENLGPRLTTYIEQLSKTPPIAVKKSASDWQLWQSDELPMTNPGIISGGAFCWTKESDLALYLKKCEFDMVMAIEFDSIEQSALLHLLVRPAAEFLLPKIDSLAQRFRGRLEIQVH